MVRNQKNQPMPEVFAITETWLHRRPLQSEKTQIIIGFNFVSTKIEITIKLT